MMADSVGWSDGVLKERNRGAGMLFLFLTPYNLKCSSSPTVSEGFDEILVDWCSHCVALSTLGLAVAIFVARKERLVNDIQSINPV
jgi:hypothetical protein